jgi:hypothetical protein
MKITRPLSIAALALSVSSCGATPTAVSTVVTEIIDIADAACQLAEQQPDPAWVYYVCTVAGAPPGVATQYTARVLPAQSAAFAAAHTARVDGGVK